MATNAGNSNLVKGLGLLDATMIVTGGMIGSGIFIVSADIARQVNSPALLLATWVITAILTLIAALSYGELAAAMPQAGGQYIYLREAFGKLPAFLFGWTFFVVIQTGTIAAVAVAFAKFAGVFFPAIQGRWLQIVGIAVIALLSWVNTKGVRTGAIVQNIFTIAKVVALLGLVVLGLALGRNETAIQANFGNFWANADWTWAVVSVTGVAMVGSLFSSDSWNNITFLAGEMRNPKRDLPLSLAIGVGLVSVLYLLANIVYLSVLPLAAIQNAPQDRVGTAVVQSFLGLGAEKWMAAAIMISTFGCVNGLILAGARVYYAMANDGLFFKVCGRLDPKSKTPVISIAVQCLWACGLTLTGKYGDLLDYVIFAVLLFYVMTIWGIFVLRRKRPEMERPYKAFGYPVLPFLYIVFAGMIEILLLLYKPNYTWPGLIIVLLGIPVYYIWKKNEVLA
ncbi:APC family permease [Bryobacter aggregatus]|uniref:APC family permease n=1 Tax=Bryobacter aggregatus TaxID=360054 RepID=UPI0004E14DCD|nr:amino acid permease [Bryobacter aggregatus]